ncbi:alpha/beta fold hydrolase [Sutcliffiella horikoshii]|uniref:alpha/beta fold hydrolase n=1 Tax=Sutcliffiella horikoshii TaxID=79883 RepID=UPI003CF4105E
MILHTEISGHGKPLVLLHSGGMTGTNEYMEQAASFVDKGYMVIRPDLRGHGKSVGTIEKYFSHCAKDIFDTLEHLQVDTCHIAGVSVGGVAALLFAKSYPEKVDTLCFSGIFPIKPDNWDELSKEEAEGHEQLFENEEAVAFLNEIHGNNDWKALLHSFHTEDFYPFEEIGDVGNLGVPTLCMVGEKQSLEVSAAIIFQEKNPNIHMAVIPFAGHLVHREQPDLYSQTLESFLQKYQKAIPQK